MDDQKLALLLGSVAIVLGLTWWLYIYCRRRFNYGVLDWVSSYGILWISTLIICGLPVAVTVLSNGHGTVNHQLWSIILGTLALVIVLFSNIHKTNILFGIIVTIAQLCSYIVGIVIYLLASSIKKRGDY